jgi:hypothetical protein
MKDRRKNVCVRSMAEWLCKCTCVRTCNWQSFNHKVTTSPHCLCLCVGTACAAGAVQTAGVEVRLRGFLLPLSARQHWQDCLNRLLSRLAPPFTTPQALAGPRFTADGHRGFIIRKVWGSCPDSQARTRRSTMGPLGAVHLRTTAPVVYGAPSSIGR